MATDCAALERRKQKHINEQHQHVSKMQPQASAGLCRM